VYDNSARREQAQGTRQQVVSTARRMLLDGGYTAMTVASLAAAAGVSPQTVYNSVGGKPAVVKAVYDVIMAGDDAEIAMSDRAEFAAMREAPDRAAFARAYAGWVRLLSGRVGPLLGVLLASGTDATLTDLITTIEEERYTGTTHAITALRERFGLPAPYAGRKGFTRLVDATWTLNAPEVYDRLVRRRGWTLKQYEAWLAGQFHALFS
jgi:AcrR family transcriptional regulator